MKAFILAAGIGKRLGQVHPKCLLKLPSDETILGNQVRLLRNNGIKEIIVIVGFKKEMIVELYPDLIYVYNPLYHTTNTSKSLLCGLKKFMEDDILWLNGDVYMEDKVIKKILQGNVSAIGVNKQKCGVEEVKYRSNQNGFITRISKNVKKAEGEAVGINKLMKSDYNMLVNKLTLCSENDYFEKGIELSIGGGAKFEAIDISEFKTKEIDFLADWKEVQNYFNKPINVNKTK